MAQQAFVRNVLQKRLDVEVKLAELLLGKVTKISKVGLAQVPCVQVKCKQNVFHEHTKMYYARTNPYWAMDAASMSKVGSAEGPIANARA